jgi:hypothetical protein
MAQLGDLARAKVLLRTAARAFGPREAVSRARCIVAETEIAFASRDLGWSAKTLDAARAALEAHGDRVNAAHARHLEIRRQVLIGHPGAAERALAELAPETLPPATRAMHELIVAGIAIRRIRTKEARLALTRATRAARDSGIPALIAEVAQAARLLDAPAARLVGQGDDRVLTLEDVESILSSDALVVDACQRVVRGGAHSVSLATRPVLFALVRTLAESWPGDVPRDVLIASAFGSRIVDESHRARLRVEMVRLRATLRDLLAVSATKRGFTLELRDAPGVVVLAHPFDDENAGVLALLADGESWSSSALALALGTSQRTTQRALETLAARGKAQSFGHGRARRWVTPPVPGFATTLLLPDSLPIP